MLQQTRCKYSSLTFLVGELSHVDLEGEVHFVRIYFLVVCRGVAMTVPPMECHGKPWQPMAARAICHGIPRPDCHGKHHDTQQQVPRRRHGTPHGNLQAPRHGKPLFTALYAMAIPTASLAATPTTTPTATPTATPTMTPTARPMTCSTASSTATPAASHGELHGKPRQPLRQVPRQVPRQATATPAASYTAKSTASSTATTAASYGNPRGKSHGEPRQPRHTATSSTIKNLVGMCYP